MLRRHAASVGAEERTGAGARRPRDRMAAGLHVPGARRRRPPPAQCRAAPGSGPQRSRAAATEPGPGRGEGSQPARLGPPLGSPPAARGKGREGKGGEGGKGKERKGERNGPDRPLSAFSGSRAGSAARSRPTRRGADLVRVPRAGGGAQHRAGAALAVRAAGAERAALRPLPAAMLAPAVARRERLAALRALRRDGAAAERRERRHRRVYGFRLTEV